MRILVTGGTGYIGSHTCISLLAAGYEPVIVDNLSNSKRAVLDRLFQITGQQLKFHEGDILDQALLERVLEEEKIEAVIHFAGLKAVGESVSIPVAYYENNVAGTVSLLKAMENKGVRCIVFSSSATVYGDPETLPIPENGSTQCHESLRPHEAVHRRDTSRSGGRGSAMGHRAAPLFQPGRRPSDGVDRRGSSGHPQQPHAVRGPGRGRAP